MKIRPFIFFSLLLIFSCKKEEVNPTGPVTPATPSPQTPRLKTVTSVTYNNQVAQNISTSTYFYDINLRPISVQARDSSLTGSWVNNIGQVFQYTGFGKISDVVLSGDFPGYIGYYYDNTNRIRKELTSFLGSVDSSLFHLQNNILVSTKETASNRILQYYSDNLDSTVIFDLNDNSRYSKTFYFYSQKEDLNNKYFNGFAPYITAKHELVKDSNIRYAVPFTTVNHYERTYNQKGYPAKVIVKQNGQKVSETDYTYF